MSQRPYVLPVNPVWRAARRCFPIIVAALALQTACGSDAPSGNSGPRLTLTVADPSFSVGVGATYRIAAELRDRSGALVNQPGAITWSSSDPARASVDSTGLVRGIVLGGPVTIAARVGTQTRTATGTVVPASVTIAPHTTEIEVGSSIQFSATARDASGNVLDAGPVVWATQAASGTPIATITPTGLFTATAYGESRVSATIAGTRSELVVGTPSPYDGNWNGARADGVAIVLHVRYGAVRNIRFPAIPIQLCTTVQLNFDVFVPILNDEFSVAVGPEIGAGAGIVRGTFASPTALNGTQGTLLLGVITCDSGQMTGMRLFPASTFVAGR